LIAEWESMARMAAEEAHARGITIGGPATVWEHLASATYYDILDNQGAEAAQDFSSRTHLFPDATKQRKGNEEIDAARNAGLDYFVFHSYSPDALALSQAIDYARRRFGSDRVATNEMGFRTDDNDVTTAPALAAAVRASGIDFAIWFGSGSGPNDPVGLWSGTGIPTLAGKSLADDIAANVPLVTVQVDADPPVVATVCPGAPVILRASASATWTASDAESGLASTAAGSVAVPTSTIGPQVATAPTATDNVGHVSPIPTCGYGVIYAFSGFSQPVDNEPTLNVAKAGSAIPVKFSLAGDQGLLVIATGSPTSTKTACDGSGGLDGIEETVQAGESSLSYDPVANQYVYVWKTDKAWAGTCRQLSVHLAEGTTHIATFQFSR
jgi:hypothetical protein